MNILVCVKRVPATGGRIGLTPDAQQIDTRYLGFTVSPHEECAVEEAVRLVEANGGSTTVLTLGPAAAEDQLRDAMAIGIERAILLEIEGRDWDTMATAAAIVEAIRADEAAREPFDLILFGNESADTGGFQVGIRVAHALDRPVVTGVKSVAVRDGSLAAKREAAGGGWETYDVELPAVLTVKEGINLPRYPSVPGRLRAKRKEIERVSPVAIAAGVETIGLRLPTEAAAAVEVLGRGPDAAPAVVDMLERIGVVRG